MDEQTREAVRLFQQEAREIGLILPDAAMPGMDGLDTLEYIRRIRPDIPVLVCSGFGDVDVETGFAGKNIAGFFSKPYTEVQFARRVKKCMASTGAGD